MPKSLRSPLHTAMMHVLKEIRAEKGLTQRELAERLGRPYSYVAKIETGERRLDVPEFIEYMQISGNDPSDVIARICEHSQSAKPDTEH
ncbi:helix-turn-helix domain-containing protein [Paracoccaceae bacterium GXU_MW_L88]